MAQDIGELLTKKCAPPPGLARLPPPRPPGQRSAGAAGAPPARLAWRRPAGYSPIPAPFPRLARFTSPCLKPMVPRPLTGMWTRGGAPSAASSTASPATRPRRSQQSSRSCRSRARAATAGGCRSRERVAGGGGALPAPEAPGLRTRSGRPAGLIDACSDTLARPIPVPSRQPARLAPTHPPLRPFLPMPATTTRASAPRSASACRPRGRATSCRSSWRPSRLAWVRGWMPFRAPAAAAP